MTPVGHDEEKSDLLVLCPNSVDLEIFTKISGARLSKLSCLHGQIQEPRTTS